MKAMILAAGQGTRLSPINREMPKPLIPLAGTRILDLILTQLASQNIIEVAINTSFEAQQISDVYQDGHQFGVNLLYSYEGISQNCSQDQPLLAQPLGSAGGMMQVHKNWRFFDDTFIVVCGDAYFDIDLRKALEAHYQKHALATVIVKQLAPDRLHNYGVVDFDKNDRVSSFQEKPKPTEAVSDWVNTGIYIFNKRIFDFIPEQGHFDIGSELLPLLVDSRQNFYVHKTTGTWLDIGNLHDLYRATEKVLNNEVALKPQGNRFGSNLWINPSAILRPANIICRGPIMFESGCIIERNAEITGPTVIGRNCRVQTGAHLDRCLVLGQHLDFPPNTHLSKCIITNHYVIRLDGKYDSLEDCGIQDMRGIKNVCNINQRDTTPVLLTPKPKARKPSLAGHV